MNFGAIGKPATPITPTTSGGGLKPNSFALQMSGLPQRPTIGFGPGSEKLPAQIVPGLTQTVQPQTPEAPAPAPENPWADMGMLGGLFQWIDSMRVQSGMPSLLENGGLMENIRKYSPPNTGP